MQSYHSAHFEKYTKQKTELAELRVKSRTKRSLSKAGLSQPRLEAGANKTLQVRDNDYHRLNFVKTFFLDSASG